MGFWITITERVSGISTVRFVDHFYRLGVWHKYGGSSGPIFGGTIADGSSGSFEVSNKGTNQIVVQRPHSV